MGKIMIAANDLRIGNWVQLTDAWYKNHPQYYNEPKMQKVKTFNYDYLLKTHYINSYDLSDLEPITLTEKILLDCGFVRNFNIDYRFHHLKIDITIDMDDYGLQISDTWEFGNIKYLHELQNLFYSLSKTELIINL